MVYFPHHFFPELLISEYRVLRCLSLINLRSKMHQTALGVNLLYLSGSLQRRLLPYFQNLSSFSLKPPLGGLFGIANTSKLFTFRCGRWCTWQNILWCRDWKSWDSGKDGYLKTKIKGEKELGASLTTNTKMDVLQHPEQLIYTHAVLFVKACWVDLLGGGDNCYQFLQFLLELVGSVFPTPNPSTLQTGMLCSWNAIMYVSVQQKTFLSSLIVCTCIYWRLTPSDMHSLVVIIHHKIYYHGISIFNSVYFNYIIFICSSYVSSSYSKASFIHL